MSILPSSRSVYIRLTVLDNHQITSAIDRKELTAGLFLDLSRAFDTIGHDILFAKLEHYGICGLALKWIKSYFLNRKQFIQFNQTCSSEQTIMRCSSRVNFRAPILYFYINASKLTETLIFADDTSIFYSQSDSKYLKSIMNQELKNFDI